MPLAAQVVQLSAIELDRATLAVRTRATAKTNGEASKGFPDYEWSRLSYVFRRLIKDGQSYLEVGPGRGYFCSMAARFRKFETVVAADIVPRRNLPTRVEFHETSIEKLDFPDRSFDAVVCMEVLEHLGDETLASGLANLRRMCANQLIVTVPFAEPLPLPAYHKQSFSEARIKETFPTGKYSLMLKEPITRVPWMMIEERHGAPA